MNEMNRHRALRARKADTSLANKWDDVTPADFGPQEDYVTVTHGHIVELRPISNAALQWCHKFLPADCPRWGTGFVIEARYIDDITAGMRNANLMSTYEFTQAQDEQREIEFNQALQAMEDAS